MLTCAMENILQTPRSYNSQGSYPLWLVLHGAYANAEKALAMFNTEAEARATFLLAPQATRPCGDGFCWSYARDARSIQDLIHRTLANHPIDRTMLSLIGHSMGCVMGLWLMAQNPSLFRFFAALGMGSPFEPWEYDDGGIDRKGLSVSASFTPILLAVDQSDPARAGVYFEDNLLQLRRLGFKVETFRPNAGTHDVTDELKNAVLQELR